MRGEDEVCGLKGRAKQLFYQRLAYGPNCVSEASDFEYESKME